MEVYDLFEENKWDTYMSREFQFQREMRLEALHKKNLVKAKKVIVDSITDQLVW